jgi:hypothetical protein
MLAIEYSTREVFNMLITVQWEWLLATIIFTNKLLTSRLERSSHKTETNNDLLINIETVTRNAQLATRKPEHGTRNAQPETRNPKRATRNYVS